MIRVHLCVEGVGGGSQQCQQTPNLLQALSFWLWNQGVGGEVSAMPIDSRSITGFFFLLRNQEGVGSQGVILPRVPGLSQDFSFSS